MRVKNLVIEAHYPGLHAEMNGMRGGHGLAWEKPTHNELPCQQNHDWERPSLKKKKRLHPTSYRLKNVGGLLRGNRFGGWGGGGGRDRYNCVWARHGKRE